ncbi:hypothetical protein KAR91_45905 [Candidatus Pacearchaeota archaeon]|nr:hypothetical protein [Candidatus Pacearchaeota archaeon]
MKVMPWWRPFKEIDEQRILIQKKLEEIIKLKDKIVKDYEALKKDLGRGG